MKTLSFMKLNKTNVEFNVITLTYIHKTVVNKNNFSLRKRCKIDSNIHILYDVLT